MNARKIAITGVLSAVAILLGMPPLHLGFIPWFSGVAITIMAAPVIIGAVLEGPLVGLIIGFLFGLSSIVDAAVMGGANLPFTNPLISVLPRMLIGPVAWLLYRAIERFNVPSALVVAGIGGSLTNTLVVLPMLGVFKVLPWGVPMLMIALVNGGPEAAANAILALVIVAAWKRIEYGRKGARLE